MAIFSQQASVIEQMVPQVHTNFCFSTSTMNGMSAGQQATAVVDAMQDSFKGLGQAMQAREDLSSQLNGGVLNIPSAAGGSLGVMSMATSAMIGVGLSALNPVAGAIYMAADTLHAGVRMLSGAGHAGLSHAAIDGGPSEFRSPISKSDKKAGGYTDVLGDTWGDDGFRLSDIKATKPAAGPVNSLDAGGANFARKQIDQFGEDEVRQQLAATSKIEKRFIQQATAAREFAENHLGATGLPDASAAFKANMADMTAKPDLKPSLEKAPAFIHAPAFA